MRSIYGFTYYGTKYLFLSDKNITKPPLFIIENSELLLNINTGLVLKNRFNEEINLKAYSHYSGVADW